MKKVLVATLLLISPLTQGEPLVRSAGQVLLDSFQCSNVGNRSRQVLRSMQVLKDAIDQIEDEKDHCKQVAATIADIPSLSNVLDNIVNNRLVEQIKEEEQLISEALANLNTVKNLPSDSSDRDLYPSEADLNYIIVDSRTSLIRLRAELKIQGGVEEEQNVAQ